MEELEFSKEIVKILDKEVLQKTLKIAATRGFTVQGFEKTVWKAPVTMVNAALGKRKHGGKYQYRILLECLAELEEEYEEIDLARKWLKDINERSEIEKRLLEIISYKQTKKGIEIIETDVVISDDTEEKGERSNDVLFKQQMRIKKMQKTIQELRITADDYKKKMEHFNKEKLKLEKICEEEQRKNKNLTADLEELKLQISKYHQQLSQRDEELNNYKKVFERAPKIACFSKKRLDDEIFPFQNIEQIKEWKSEFRDIIQWEKYQEVWIVESDFSYPEVINIRKRANGKVICARNLKSLIEKVGGISYGYTR